MARHGVGADKAELKLELHFKCTICGHPQIQILDEETMSFDLDIHGYSSLDWDLNCEQCKADLFYEKTL